MLGLSETDRGRSRLLMAHVPQIKVGGRVQPRSHPRGPRPSPSPVPAARCHPLARIILACGVTATASSLQLAAFPRLQQRAGSRKCDAEVWLPAIVPRVAIRAATRMQDDDGPSSFAEYLVPYALAVVAALLATSAFFAFLNGAI